MKKSLYLILHLTVLMSIPVYSQSPEPTPAFPGQTEATAPAKTSKYKVETVTSSLNSPWGLAFLPDGNYLVTERLGTMRTVTPDGIISDPISGVPGIKVTAAQGLHDVVLDPDFENNRLLYFTYFAPPKGEAPAIWPSEHYYDNVWSKSLAERRTLDIGDEHVGRARLSEDNRSLKNVEVLIEGRAERRIVFAPDGTLYITGADAFRFYDSDIDGVDHDFTDNPDIRRNFSGRVIRIKPDGALYVFAGKSIFEENSLLRLIPAD